MRSVTSVSRETDQRKSPSGLRLRRIWNLWHEAQTFPWHKKCIRGCYLICRVCADAWLSEATVKWGLYGQHRGPKVPSCSEIWWATKVFTNSLHTHTHTEVTPTHTGLAPTKMKHKCELFPLTHIGCGHIRLLLLFSWWGSAATETVTHNACTVTHTLLNHHLNTLNWQHYLTININFLRIFGTEFLKTDFCESTMHWCRNLRKHAMIHDKALSAQYSFALSGYSHTFKCKVLI